MSLNNNKLLGQHWLKDRDILAQIADSADLTKDDVVLEIGPGLGTLTSHLLNRSAKVIAVELDKALADKLPGQFPGKNLTVINTDIIDFSLDELPIGYKVVANIPYYLTSRLIRKLMTSKNRPQKIVLLVQKEVAQRLAALPGEMSVLAISAQLFSTVRLGQVVKAEFFSPPPKVDSQVVILDVNKKLPANFDQTKFFRAVKAGFLEKRKKLKTSLSSGLALPKVEVVEKLEILNLRPDCRAEDLSLADWLKIADSLL